MLLKLQFIVLATFNQLIINVLLKNAEVTFTTSGSFAREVGYEGSYNMNMSLQLRTWQEEGVLVFHKFSSKGHLKMFLHKGVLRAEIASESGGTPQTVLEHYDTPVNDGEWHSVQLYIAQTQVGLSLDQHTVRGSLPALIRTGGW